MRPIVQLVNLLGYLINHKKSQLADPISGFLDKPQEHGVAVDPGEDATTRNVTDLPYIYAGHIVCAVYMGLAQAHPNKNLCHSD